VVVGTEGIRGVEKTLGAHFVMQYLLTEQELAELKDPNRLDRIKLSTDLVLYVWEEILQARCHASLYGNEYLHSREDIFQILQRAKKKFSQPPTEVDKTVNAS